MKYFIYIFIVLMGATLYFKGYTDGALNAKNNSGQENKEVGNNQLNHCSNNDFEKITENLKSSQNHLSIINNSQDKKKDELNLHSASQNKVDEMKDFNEEVNRSISNINEDDVDHIDSNSHPGQDEYESQK